MDDQPCRDFFLRPGSTSHRRYEALRAFFVDRRPSAEVALQFGYKPAAFKVLISRFRHGVHGQDLPPFSSPTVADGHPANGAVKIGTALSNPPSRTSAS